MGIANLSLIISGQDEVIRAPARCGWTAPGAGVKAGRRPPEGLGLDAGEDVVRFGRAGELIKTVGVGCRVQRVVERRVVEADMRGLVTAGPCVRLERAAGLRTSVALMIDSRTGWLLIARVRVAPRAAVPAC